MSTIFADVVPVRQITSHSYAIDLGDEWCIGNGMNTSQSFVNITYFPDAPIHVWYTDTGKLKSPMAATSPRVFYSLPAPTCP
jgi:hypothetical protein